MKIVADTNVIISMLLWGKSLERLFNLINERKVVLCFSPETIDELFRVISYPHIQKQADKFKIPITALLDKLISASHIYYPTIKVDVIKEDKSDNKLIEVALEANAEYLISGDKHVTTLKSYKGILILAPSTFLTKI